MAEKNLALAERDDIKQTIDSVENFLIKLKSRYDGLQEENNDLGQRLEHSQVEAEQLRGQNHYLQADNDRLRGELSALNFLESLPNRERLISLENWINGEQHRFLLLW